MKICLINCLFPPYRAGGAEVVSQKIAHALHEQGHEVFVITNGHKDEQDKLDGMRIFRLAPRNLFSYIDIQEQPLWKRVIWHWKDQTNKAQADRVKEILKDESPDLVLTHNLKGLSYLVPKVVSELGIDHVHTLHDIQLSVPSGAMYKGREHAWMVSNPYTWAYEARSRKLFSYCTHVVSPSQWLIDFYQRRGFFGSRDVRVLRNPIILDREYHEKEFNGFYAVIGHVTEEKGVPMLLEVFDEFVQDHSEAKLLVVGSGSESDELKRIYEKNSWVTFMGYVPYDQLPQKVFDLVSYAVLPSMIYENSPGLVYDASAHSTPVVVAEIGGAAEMVVEGGNGFVFQAGDRRSMLRALEKTYEYKDQYKGMARRAREMIDDHSMQNYLNNLFSITNRPEN